jgi:hypothetical protein
LLTEVRALRAELRQAASTSMQAQLMTARLRSQEARVITLAQQLSNVRQQIADTQLALAPFAAQMRQAPDVNSEVFAPIRNTIDQLQKRDSELRSQETAISQLLAGEESRWTEFNTRLNELEQALARSK